MSSAHGRRNVGGQVSSITIPVTSSPYYTGTLGVSDGRIVVGDETGGARCRLAVVDPISLKLISNRTTSCDTPELFGEMAVPIESVPHPETQTGVVRISTYDTKAHTFHVGPVVLQYGNFSSSRPEWTYGDRSLWIFDADGFTTGTFKNGRSVLLRVSLSSGKVLARFTLPTQSRIVLAADQDGLWFARTVESDWSGREPASLYFLGNGSKRPVVVSRKGAFVGWLVASDRVARAFFVEDPAKNSGEVDTFSSARAVTTVVHLGANTTVPREIGEEDFDAEPVLTTQGYGLVFVWPLYSASNSAEVKSERVFLFDPATGHETKLATIPTQPYEYLQPNIVYDGSLYLLVGGQQGVNSVTLYRAAL